MELDVGLGAKQFKSLREAHGRVNIWEGSIRSGKTIVSLIRWLIYVATAPSGGQLVMIGRTRDSLWRNVIAPMQDKDIFGILADQVVGNYGAPTVTILGRRIFVLGASDTKAEKVLRGLTVAGAYVDEVTTLQENFFTTLLGRMSVRGAALFGTTNPDNPAHWLKRKFLDRIKEMPDWRRWHFTVYDNPSLSADYIASIEREFTGLWYRRFIKGEWVSAEGAIYSMWDPDVHVVPWELLPQMDRLLAVGVDYGTTNATSAMMLGLGANKLWLVDEWRHDPALSNVRLTDSQLSAGLRGWLNEEHLPRQRDIRPEWICVDPSAASFKMQLHGDGVGNVTDADNHVSFGIRMVASLMGQGNLLVSDRCAGFIQEAPGYSWDDKATTDGYDKPVKVADHSLDAGRYAVASTESLWRPRLAA